MSLLSSVNLLSIKAGKSLIFSRRTSQLVI
jgi:hypothetical protein